MWKMEISKSNIKFIQFWNSDNFLKQMLVILMNENYVNISLFFKELFLFWSVNLSICVLVWRGGEVVGLFVYLFFFFFPWDIHKGFELILKKIFNIVVCFGRSGLEKQIVAVHCRVNLLNGAILILWITKVAVVGLKHCVELDCSEEFFQLQSYLHGIMEWEDTST